MKRKILLLTILCGLIILEWGCDDGQGGRGGGYSTIEVDSISETFTLKVDSFCNFMEQNPDTVKFDEFLIRIQFEEKYVKNVEPTASDFSAYAAPALRLSINWQLDSIKVIDCQTVDSVDVTSLFAFSQRRPCREGEPLTNDDKFRDKIRNTYWEIPLEQSLYMILAPVKVQVSKFRILFYTENGDVFEALTEPVIITP